MTKVCVIGGGTAGREAATEASRRGAEVTLIERSEHPDPPWVGWPGLLSEGPGAHSSWFQQADPPYDVLRSEVAWAESLRLKLAGGARLECDRVVHASGSSFESPRFRGRRKAGVHVLNRAGQFSLLGAARGSASNVVVVGEGSRALVVADRMAGEGRRVTALITRWSLWEPGAEVLAVLLEGAACRGVAVRRGTVESALGRDALEAVVVDGEVLPCDVLAVLPERAPRVVPSDVPTGQRGGALVDQRLATVLPAVYASGGCAELVGGAGGSAILDDHAGVSGRVAGANACGGDLSVDVSVLRDETVFGLRWLRAEFAPAPSTPSTLARGTASGRWGSTSACDLTFGSADGRVLAMEAIDEGLGRTFLLSGPPSLRELGYGSSSDISVISETARLGLRSGEGPDLRQGRSGQAVARTGDYC